MATGVYPSVMFRDIEILDQTAGTLAELVNTTKSNLLSLANTGRILFVNQWYNSYTLMYESTIWFVRNVDTSPQQVEVIKKF